MASDPVKILPRMYGMLQFTPEEQGAVLVGKLLHLVGGEQPCAHLLLLE